MGWLAGIFLVSVLGFLFSESSPETPWDQPVSQSTYNRSFLLGD